MSTFDYNYKPKPKKEEKKLVEEDIKLNNKTLQNALELIIRNIRNTREFERETPLIEEFCLVHLNCLKDDLDKFLLKKASKKNKELILKYYEALKVKLAKGNKMYFESLVSSYNFKMDKTQMGNIRFMFENNKQNNKILDLMLTQTKKRIKNMQEEGIQTEQEVLQSVEDFFEGGEDD